MVHHEHVHAACQASAVCTQKPGAALQASVRSLSAIEAPACLAALDTPQQSLHAKAWRACMPCLAAEGAVLQALAM